MRHQAWCKCHTRAETWSLRLTNGSQLVQVFSRTLGFTLFTVLECDVSGISLKSEFSTDDYGYASNILVRVLRGCSGYATLITELWPPAWLQAAYFSRTVERDNATSNSDLPIGSCGLILAHQKIEWQSCCQRWAESFWCFPGKVCIGNRWSIVFPRLPPFVTLYESTCSFSVHRKIQAIWRIYLDKRYPTHTASLKVPEP